VLRERNGQMEAVAFVLGALVVGGISLAQQWLVDLRRWKREDVAYDRVTRAAWRLVADELDTAGCGGQGGG